MYGMGFEENMVQEKIYEARREADEIRLAKNVGGASLRARVAKLLFGAAMKLERGATWEEMEAVRRM